MGPGLHPPSELNCKTRSGRSKTRMRLPLHVWATLSRGREAESCEFEQVVDDGRNADGVYVRARWREFDGERCWKRRRRDGSPRLVWTEYVVQRMVWLKVDGRWHGEWSWEEYDRDEEWVGETNDRWCDMDPLVVLLHRFGDIPQEVLIHMMQALSWVCAFISGSSLSRAHSRHYRTVTNCFV